MAEEQKKKTNKKRMCFFCVNNWQDIDYKDVNTIRRYVSSFGKVVARKRSKVCMGHQRKMTLAIKRARIMALVPFVQK